MKERFCIALILAGCASSLLAPRDLRREHTVEAVSVKPSTAYLRAIRWIDRNVKLIPGKPREQDTAKGMLTLHGAIECRALSPVGQPNPDFLAFQFDLTTGPASLELKWSDLRMLDFQLELIQQPKKQIHSALEIEAVRPCVEKMKAALMRAAESDRIRW